MQNSYQSKYNLFQFKMTIWRLQYTVQLSQERFNKRTECEPSQLVAAEGIAVANAANKQCSTASSCLSVNMAGGRMIGAAVQLVYNNNNELIAQQGEN